MERNPQTSLFFSSFADLVAHQQLDIILEDLNIDGLCPNLSLI